MIADDLQALLDRATAVSLPLWLRTGLQKAITDLGGAAPTAGIDELAAADGLAIDISFGDHVLPPGVKAIYIGFPGDVVVEKPSGVVLTYRNVPAGQHLITQVVRVLSTTTATDMIAEI